MAKKMKFSYDLEIPRLDMVALKKAYVHVLENANEQAGRAWLEAAINKTPIPTWSGASRATFEKLADELGTSVAYGPQRSRKDRKPLGRATSAGSGVWDEDDGWYKGFTYETELRYLAYNEYNAAVKGPPPQPYSNNVRFTPYNFQDRARNAWEAEAKKVKLPDPTKYIKITRKSG